MNYKNLKGESSEQLIDRIIEYEKFKSILIIGLLIIFGYSEIKKEEQTIFGLIWVMMIAACIILNGLELYKAIKFDRGRR